ncbi:MAG TPA: hypothetical protein VJR29_04045 [bacterium]|nr:hypothetical protein [bacterium]
MKNNTQKISSLLLSAVLVLGLGLSACSKKEGSTTGDSGQSGENTLAAGSLSCEPGEFLDASGKAKTKLTLRPSLYPGLVAYNTFATMAANQDLLVKDGTTYYVRSEPKLFRLSVNGNPAATVRTKVPTTALEIYESDGKIYLAVGSYKGIDYYEITASAANLLKSDTSLGLVTDISSRGKDLCVAADGGNAVVRTSSEATGGVCGQLLYNAAPVNGRPELAQHVAAVTDGCAVSTRNMPRFEYSLGGLLEFIMPLLTGTPQLISVKSIEDRLLWLKTDGSTQEIKPVIGNYDKVLFSDLDSYADGAIASFTAFHKANWDGFSDQNWGGTKVWLLLKTFCEIRAGGLFLSDGAIKKSVELSGMQGPFNLSPSHVLAELPHFSLPYFPEGAVDASRYAIKGYWGLSLVDFSNYTDPSVTSLPVQERSKSSDPNLPRGLFTDMQLQGDKLFLNGSSAGRLLANYDLGTKQILDSSNGNQAYEPLDSRMNIATGPTTVLLPLAPTREGYVAMQIPAVGGKYLFYKKADFDSAREFFKVMENFDPTLIPNLSDFTIANMPVSFDSPAGAGNDKLGWAYVNPTAKQMIFEVTRPNGVAVAFTPNALDWPNIQSLAPKGGLSLNDDLLVFGTNDSTGNYSLFAFSIDPDGSIIHLPLQTGMTSPSFHSVPGKVAKVAGLQKLAENKYQVLAVINDGGPKVARITFERNDTHIIAVDPQTVAAPDIRDLVTDGASAYIVNKTGDIVPLNAAGTTLTAEASLGSILDDPAHSFSTMASCALVGKEVFCGGFFSKSPLRLFRFNVDLKQQTTLAHHQPLFFTNGSSKLLMTYRLDGGGIEVFDPALAK